MIETYTRSNLLQRLDEVRLLCPEMRLGQFMATLGLLGEDATGLSLWDIADEELAVAIEKFAADLTRRAGKECREPKSM